MEDSTCLDLSHSGTQYFVRSFIYLFVTSSVASNANITTNRIDMATATPAVMAQKAEKSKPQGLDLYSRFALAGALGCSITHGAFTPVDVFVPIRLRTRYCSQIPLY